MVSIMKMAIEEKLKAEIKDGVDVIFRLPDGKKKSQRFSPEEPIANLYDFIWVDRNPKSRFYLVDMGSKNKLLDLEIPIMSIEDPNDHTVMVNVCDVWPAILLYDTTHLLIIMRPVNQLYAEYSIYNSQITSRMQNPSKAILLTSPTVSELFS